MNSKLLAVSTFTMVLLYSMLSVVILGVCLFTDIPMTYGIVVSLIVLFLQFFISPWITDFVMKHFYHASFDYTLPDYLNAFINKVCEEYGIVSPKVGFIDDGAPNAFTYGRTKKDARIVITRGIIDLLTEDEVKAVVGHELGHIAHMDMFYMTVAQAVPLILYFVFKTLCDPDRKSSDNDKNSGYSAIIGIVAYIMYIISQYIILWLSRTREYYADEFSCEVTGNPNSLATALVKIGFGLTSIKDTNAKHAVSNVGALGIFDSKTSKSLIVSTNRNMSDTTMIKNAMKWELWNPWAFFYELNSTHPLISKRLIAISNQCSKYNQPEYIKFDLEKPESYVDDFFCELVIAYAPSILFILGLIDVIYCLATDKIQLMFTTGGIFGILLAIASLVHFSSRHGNNYKQANVAGLLGQVKVSEITAIPCELEGQIIGKGDPGCIFSEDFILQDETGIIFLDYKQPLTIQNKIFALFRSKDYIDAKVKIKGWYRRGLVPYIEVYQMERDGKTKTIHTAAITKGFYYLMMMASAALVVWSLI